MARPEVFVSKSKALVFRAVKVPGFTGGGWRVQQRYASETRWHNHDSRVYQVELRAKAYARSYAECH